MRKRPRVTTASSDDSYGALSLDAEARAQVKQLFALLDKDSSGTLSRDDLPQHWEALCRAFNGAGPPSELTFEAFVAEMKRVALRQPFDALPAGGCTNAQLLVLVEASLNTAFKNAVFELDRFCRSGGAAGADQAVPVQADPAARFHLGDFIGEGGFASVRRVTERQSGQSYALKLVAKGSGTKLEEVQEELRVMRLIGRHRHLIGLVDAFEDAAAWGFVLELAEGGPLFDRMVERGAYSEGDAATVVRQVGAGLHHLHALGLAHCDLKPENLLLRSPAGGIEVALCDFGLTTAPPLHGVVGTFPYMAPDIFGEGGWGAPVDLWALGVLVYNLLSGEQPFDTGAPSEDELRRRITAGEWHMAQPCWRYVSAEAQALLAQLLHPQPDRRPTAEALLQLPWVSGVGAPSRALPDAAERLAAFNADRRVWRAAVCALALLTSACGPAAAGAVREPGAAPAEEAAALSAEARAELQAAFRAFDADGNGTIDEAELRQVVRSLGAREGEVETAVRRVLEGVDADGDGLVSMDEFCAGVAPLIGRSDEALRRAFAVFDADGSGGIERPEFSSMLVKLNLVPPGGADAIARMFAAADRDGNGMISFAEFVTLVTGMPQS